MSLNLYTFLGFDNDELREIEEEAKYDPKKTAEKYHLGKFKVDGRRDYLVLDTSKRFNKAYVWGHYACGTLAGEKGKNFLSAIPDMELPMLMR